MPVTDLLKVQTTERAEAACGDACRPQRRALLGREDVESLKRLGLEVEVASPFGSFWIVPQRTGEDRVEFTPEDVVAVVDLVRIFGGRVAGLTRDGKPLACGNPSDVPEFDPEEPGGPGPEEAREHLRRLRDRAPAQAAGQAPSQGALFTVPGTAKGLA